MGEVLSQNEIDSLLQALSSGELDTEELNTAEEKATKNYANIKGSIKAPFIFFFR